MKRHPETFTLSRAPCVNLGNNVLGLCGEQTVELDKPASDLLKSTGASVACGLSDVCVPSGCQMEGPRHLVWWQQPVNEQGILGLRPGLPHHRWFHCGCKDWDMLFLDLMRNNPSPQTGWLCSR